METKAGSGVTAFQSNMIRGGMETAIANAEGYEGFDRSAFDVIMREQNFQRSGAVDESQIKELGQMVGVQYILVTEAEYEEGYLYILAKLLDVETGKYGKAYDKLCEANPSAIREACLELGEHLFDITLSHHITPKSPVNNNSPQTIKEQPIVVSKPKSKVGDVKIFPDGTQGVVFYMENGKGLAVSLTERELKWDNSPKLLDVTSLDNMEQSNHPFIYGEGMNNTRIIMQTLGNNAIAASWCTEMGEGWYMPSSGELFCLMKASRKGSVLFNKLNSLGARLSGWYWASTEHDRNEAINVSDGGTVFTERKRSEVKVRAIRAFTE